MRIEVLSNDCWDVNGVHFTKKVWDISRGSTDSNLDDILRVNAPVNEMPSALLFVRSTIVEREIIASIREHSMWSTSSRVDDVTTFQIDTSLPLEAHEYAASQRARMLRSKDRGDGQDQWRLHMPLTALTNYVVRLNLRACSMLHSYFLDLANLNTDTAALFGDAAHQMKRIVKMMGGDIYYPTGDLLGGELNSEPKFKATLVGDYVHVSLLAPFSLRTHLIRHRLISMRDNLRAWIRYGIHKCCLNDIIYIEAMAPVESWLNINAKRACWIAQADLWDPMLRLVMDAIGQHNMKLPCDNGKCPVQKDCYLRLEGRDPNPPCPRHAHLYKIALTPDQMDQIKVEIKRGQRSQFWSQYVD